MVPTNELEDFPRRARTRKIALACAIAALGVGLLAYGILKPAPDASGGRAPDFELPLLNAPGTLSSEELKGSPVVVNFFASWCIPCREEAPLLQETFARYEDRGVRFVGVSIRDAESDARDFADKYGITYPVVHDPREVFARKVGVLGLPETYFIDATWNFTGESKGRRIGNRSGTVWFGPITEEALVEEIDSLLAQGGGNSSR